MCPPEMITSTGSGLAVICLLFNIFIPGFGTMINACAGTQYVGKGICYGILQFLLAPLLIGWIWSIIYGIKILQASGNRHVVVEQR
ncbi:UNKNOWN [Stylonychia lemnae]|uniref:Transmembrane protein n=1 Tax=Stylonychia lemnae TaxID=5949 RepID=A0A078BCX2_STYLE|nr:UNKNOWN [Stylonychia lemnae]|eukprot:CDW91067.1 UNKNOWN [Stylonychia lemnae]